MYFWNGKPVRTWDYSDKQTYKKSWTNLQEMVNISKTGRNKENHDQLSMPVRNPKDGFQQFNPWFHGYTHYFEGVISSEASTPTVPKDMLYCKPHSCTCLEIYLRNRNTYWTIFLHQNSTKFQVDCPWNLQSWRSFSKSLIH